MEPTRHVYSLDIGSDHTRLVLPRKGLVFNEFSCVVLEVSTNRYKEVGNAGRNFRLTAKRQLVWPFAHGVIADFEAASALLEKVFALSASRATLIKPNLIVTTSAAATQAEQRALLEALPPRLFHKVFPIPAILAAALGAVLPVRETAGGMVLHFGAGATEGAMFGSGEIIFQNQLKVGMTDVIEAIEERFSRLAVAPLSAAEVEDLITNFLDVSPLSTAHRTYKRSKNTANKKRVTISNDLLVATLEPILARWVNLARSVIESSPAEQVGALFQNGILLTGGGAQLKGLDSYLSKKLKVSCVVAEEPALCAVRGASLASTYLNDYLTSLQ